LYDLNSKVVLENDFSGETIVNISQLPGGIYIYEISQESMILERGKWVKHF
jgi:hypothetical protein